MLVDKNSFPRVLIIGETFRYTGGGGITMINLFKDWNSVNLACVTEKISETTSETNCKKIYSLGRSEIKFPFPFNYINKLDKSGEIILKDSKITSLLKVETKRKIKSIIKFGLEQAYYKLLIFLGLCNSNYKIVLSDHLVKWIMDFSPDVIYTQPFRYRDMVFAKELKEAMGIPLALHIMDDAVSFSNKPNLLYFYWKKKISHTFRRLIETSDFHFSISESMSEEYFKRYKKHFIPFRNPIDVNTWAQFVKNDWSIQEEINIIYTGRLAMPNINALLTFCNVVNQFNKTVYPARLHIYSIDKNAKFRSKVSNLKSVIIHNSVSFDKIPQLITKFDIALLPIDFTKKGIAYSRYSISTKTSEYMISGVPILLFAPKHVALTVYAEKNSCMYSVSENNEAQLAKALAELLKNKELRTSLALKAITVAKTDSDAIVVRKNFREALSRRINDC